jgi:hypothetical protein
MRSRNEIPHDKIPYYPDLLKKAGYHTSNPGKTDYNIGGRDDYAAWDLGKQGGRKKRVAYGWQGPKKGAAVFLRLQYHLRVTRVRRTALRIS